MGPPRAGRETSSRRSAVAGWSAVEPIIRPVRADDLDRVLAINEANVPEVGPLDRERLAFLVGEAAIALVVEDGEDVAGFVLVLASGSTYDSVNYRWFMERDPTVLYLDRVAIDERFRGHGLGSALYSRVLDEMSVDHPRAPELTLEVNVDPPNEPSLAFHRRLGFVEVGRQMSKGIEVSLMALPVPRDDVRYGSDPSRTP